MGDRDMAKQEETETDTADKINKHSGNKTEAYYRTIFEQSPDGILVIDTTCKIIDFNEAACNHLGYSKEEFSKLSISDIDSGETPEVTQERIENILKDGRAEFEVKHRTKKGEIRDVLVITQVINLEGRIVLNSLWKDITDRRMAAVALQESEKRHRLIAENTYDMITRHLPDGTYLYVSPSSRKLLGYKPEELIGKKAFDFIHPEDIKRVIFITQEAIRKGGSDMGQYRHLKKDGQYIWVETTGTVMKNEITGAVEDIVCVVRDISYRKNFEDRLEKIHHQQKAILDNIPDLAWLKDKEGRYIAVNEPFGKACGVEPDDLVGKSGLDIWSKELAERYRADDKEVMETRKRKQVEEPLIDKDGNKIWTETIKTPIFDSTGEVIGTAGIARDITERKQTEDSLRKEKDRAQKYLDTARVILIAINTEQEVTLINKKARGDAEGQVFLLDISSGTREGYRETSANRGLYQ